MLPKNLQLALLPILSRFAISSLDRDEVEDCGRKILGRLIDECHRLFAEGSVLERNLRKVESHHGPLDGVFVEATTTGGIAVLDKPSDRRGTRTLSIRRKAADPR